MSWFQIGSGYYGLSEGAVKVSPAVREIVAKAFKEAFANDKPAANGERPQNPPPASKK